MKKTTFKTITYESPYIKCIDSLLSDMIMILYDSPTYIGGDSEDQ